MTVSDNDTGANDVCFISVACMCTLSVHIDGDNVHVSYLPLLIIRAEYYIPCLSVRNVIESRA